MLFNWIRNRFHLALDTPAQRGRYGEQQAARFLRKEHGLKIIARNWRAGKDKIDLVCRDGEVLVFVEVRTRKEDSLVPGYHSVGGKKKQALQRACKAYLKALHKPIKHFRFDVVEVRLCKTEKFHLNYYSNVSLFKSKHTPISSHS